MRTNFDFTPYRRSTIGFDRLFDLLENAARVDTGDNYPPFDIEKTGEDSYRISIAVAGFAPGDLEVTEKPNMLIVSGRKSEDKDAHYLHRGIAARAFERRFELADFVKVKNASLDNGLLQIELMREIPEELRPRRIEIGSGAGSDARDVKQLSDARVGNREAA